jgi:predicted Fe-Mo cluster-binding NifX family protein
LIKNWHEKCFILQQQHYRHAFKRAVPENQPEPEASSMRIAIPIWEDKISPVLDTASRLLIVEIEDQNVASRFEIYLDEQDMSRRCFRIRGMDVDILICGAISHHFARMLVGSGIDVIPEISGQTEEVLKAYLQGDLFNSKFLMPGCIRNRPRQENGPSLFKRSCCQRGKTIDPDQGKKA